MIREHERVFDFRFTEDSTSSLNRLSEIVIYCRAPLGVAHVSGMHQGICDCEQDCSLGLDSNADLSGSVP